MTFRLDLRSTEPTFKRPVILQHPQIPGPLSGMNPRTILGRKWWDRERRRAYKKNHYNCHACGESPDFDPYQDKLHAHECYAIDWRHGKAVYIETVALCYSCHAFIHAGRLRALVDEGETDPKELTHILSRGVELLQSVNRYPFWRTYVIYLEYVKGVMPGNAVGQARDLGIVDKYSVLHLPDHMWTIKVFNNTYRRDENGDIQVVKDS